MQTATKVDAYIHAIMSHAVMDTWSNGSIVATVPQVPGFVAAGDDEQECLLDLQEHLEDWVRLGCTQNYRLPIVDGIELMDADLQAWVAALPEKVQEFPTQFFENEDALEAAFASWDTSHENIPYGFE